MKSLLIFSLLGSMLLSGCSNLVKTADVTTTTITWLRQEPKDCNGPDAIGCATRINNYTSCVMQVPADAPDWLIAEEFRHCFGYDHIK